MSEKDAPVEKPTESKAQDSQEKPSEKATPKKAASSSGRAVGLHR